MRFNNCCNNDDVFAGSMNQMLSYVKLEDVISKLDGI